MSLMFWAQMVGKPVIAPAPAASPAAAPAPFSSFRRLIFRRDAPARIFATDLSSMENTPPVLRAVIAPSVGAHWGAIFRPPSSGVKRLGRELKLRRETHVEIIFLSRPPP